MIVHMDRFLEEHKIPIARNGKLVWLLGTRIDLKSHDAQSKLNPEHKAKCLVVTQQEYDDIKKAIAKENNWRESDYESEWQADLAQLTESRTVGGVVYRIPAHWLGELLAWKKSLKHTGGMKSRPTKTSSKTS